MCEGKCEGCKGDKPGSCGVVGGTTHAFANQCKAPHGGVSDGWHDMNTPCDCKQTDQDRYQSVDSFEDLPPEYRTTWNPQDCSYNPWEDTAAQYARNADWYRSILLAIAAHCDYDVYLDDTGSAHLEPFVSKLPDAVKAMRDEINSLREALKPKE